jgi:hypothetical protein
MREAMALQLHMYHQQGEAEVELRGHHLLNHPSKCFYTIQFQICMMTCISTDTFLLYCFEVQVKEENCHHLVGGEEGEGEGEGEVSQGLLNTSMPRND